MISRVTYPKLNSFSRQLLNHLHSTCMQSRFLDKSGSHMSKVPDGAHIGSNQGALDHEDKGQPHLD